MFHPSHFRKTARELGMDAGLYEKEYNHFLAKLKKFHESKGSPFRRLPWLGGQFLDLYFLYKKVTSFGGWVKVTEDKRWRDIAEVFNLPSTCTNAAFALRQHYSRYLEAFERINFFGEDAEDVMTGSRPHTPVIALPVSTPSEYVTPSNIDVTRNFEKLVLSLQCGLPNEVDFGINICMLLSNVNNSVFNLTKAPAIIDMLLGHVGIFVEGSHGLGDVYSDWYQKTERDYSKFWREALEIEEFRELLCNGEGKIEDNEEITLFNPGKKYGNSSVEAQRVSQVCMILYNFSFDDANADNLASHPMCLRFLMLCICNQIGHIQSLAWNTISNLAEKMKLDPVECESTQMVFQVLHYFLEDNDRFKIVKAMDVLGKLCVREDNDEVLETAIETQAYESLVRILIIPDVQLVIGSLEALYNISGVGQTTSDHIASVDRSVDILVCMVTLDAESFGPQALSEVVIIENRLPGSITMTPRPRPLPTPTAGNTSPVTPHTPSASSSRNEVDAEVFTVKWLQATYEALPSGNVSRIDLYADYLSSCSRLARIGILNASAFNRVVKFVFPDVQLRRFQTGTQLQYALCGMRRRANPLPVASTVDQQQTPSTPVQPRTPTPPIPGRNSPNWNQPMPQRSLNITRHPSSSPTGVFSQGNIIQKTPNPLQRPTFTPGVSNDGTRLPGQFTPQSVANQTPMQSPATQQWQQQNQQQTSIPQHQPTVSNPGRPQQMRARLPGQLAGIVTQNSPSQGSQPLLRPQPQQPPRLPHMPNMVTRPGSPGQPRIAPRPQMHTQSGLVPIRPAPPNMVMQSPAPVSSQPGPGPNSRLHNGPSLIGSQRSSQVRPQKQQMPFHKTPQQLQGFQQVQRTQAPQPFSGQNRQVASQIIANQGSGGYRGSQPIAIAPKPVSNSSTTNSTSVSQKKQGTSSDGVVLIAREEKAEDILTSDILQNAEEQKIVVVENTNNGQKNTSQNNQENCNTIYENNIDNNAALIGDFKRRHANLNSEGLVNTNQIDQNGINGCKRTRLDENSQNDIVDSSLDESVVNGDIPNDSRNKLMDKLLGKDLHMPLNGMCEINSADLDLIAPEGERLSGSNSKASSPDIFDSENNSDFGKYLEESDTDTGLFSDVILGDLRIDSVETDPKSKNSDPNKTIPSLPDLGYHAVAQELRNPSSLPIRTSNESLVKKTGFPNNLHEKMLITSSIRTSQTRPQNSSDAMGDHFGSDGFQGQVTTTWNGLAARPMAPLNYNPVTQSTAPRPPAQPNLNAILEHRTKALVTPKMPSLEPNTRQLFPPQVTSSTVASTKAIPGKPAVPTGQSGAPPTQGILGQPGVTTVQGIPGQPGITTTQVISGQPGAPTNQAIPGQPVASQLVDQQLVPDTPIETPKPYRCRWASCTSSFDTGKYLFSHVISTHIPRDTLVMSCMWENCAPVRRSRSSLLFHLQQKHSGPTPVSSGTLNPPTQTPQVPPQVPPPVVQAPANQQNSPNLFPAYKLLSRMMSAMQDDEESPLTKTVRLTSALVLRNIAQYSAIARSHLRRHERLLSEVAMSHSEAAHAVAACLSELSPHRKASEEDNNTFIWAFDR